MRKVYDEFHIGLMKEFIRKYLSSIIRNDIDVDLQATKHVQYFDQEQLDLLVNFSNIEKMKESELADQLIKIGFFSKINIYERRAIFSDYAKSTITKAILANDMLIDYNLLKEKKLSNLDEVYKAVLKRFKKRCRRRLNTPNLHKFVEYDPENLGDPDRPLFLDPLDKRSIDKFFGPASMRSILPENMPQAPKSLVTHREVEILDHNALPKTKKLTIYDRIDNPNIILRRKKSLYIEKSKSIDYHSNYKTECNDIAPLIQEIPCYSPDLKQYEEFNIGDFVNQILFTNNGIPIPTTSRFNDYLDFRKNMKGNFKFVRKFLAKEIKFLLMKQDKYLSYTDATFLAGDLKKVLDLPAFEYFYNKYLDSDEYSKYEVARTGEVVKRKRDNKIIVIDKLEKEVFGIDKKNELDECDLVPDDELAPNQIRNNEIRLFNKLVKNKKKEAKKELKRKKKLKAKEKREKGNNEETLLGLNEKPKAKRGRKPGKKNECTPSKKQRRKSVGEDGEKLVELGNGLDLKALDIPKERIQRKAAVRNLQSSKNIN